MTLADSTDSMTFDLLEVPIADKDIEGAVDNTLVNGNVFTDYLWLKKQWTQKWALMCDDEYTQLRGFYTRQWENAEAPTYRLFYGNNITEDVMRNGSYITENIDAPLGAEMTLAQISGNAEQTTYSGKNLFGFSATNQTQFPATSVLKITHDNDNAVTLEALGTQGAQAGFFVLNKTLDATKTYTFSGKAKKIVKGTDGSPLISIRCYGSNDGGATWGSQIDIYTVAPTQGTEYTFSHSVTGYSMYRFYIYNNMSTPVSVGEKTTYYDLQFELGSQATDFEPYVGGTASPNPDYPQAIETVTGEQTVSVVGKNLCSGTQIPNGSFVYFYFPKSAITAGAYRLSAILNDSTSSNTLGLMIDGTSVSISATMTGSANQRAISGFNLSESIVQQIQSATTVFFRLYKSGGNFSSATEAMLEKGASVTTYEPYQSQSYEINLGKNLFDKDNYNLFNGYLNGDPTGTITANTSNDIFYIACQPNTTYTISKTASKNFAVASSAVVPSAGSAFTGRVSANNLASATITTDATAQYLIIWARNGNISGEITRQEVLNTLQVERGTQATSYASYLTPIELAKIGTYQDRIYKDDGKWYVEKQVGKVVVDENTALTVFNTSNNVVGFRLPLDSNAMPSGSGISPIISDYFQSATFNDFYNNRNYGEIASHNSATINSAYISAPNSSVTTVAQFQTWLSTHNTTVYYALATPTTTEITDEALLSQLNFIANLYGGVNHISLVPSAGAQGTMEVKIHKIYEQETEIYPQTAVRLTLTDDGIINPCGCRRNVQIKMRETIQ